MEGEGSYTINVYRLGKEAPSNRFTCLVNVTATSGNLHLVVAYSNLSYAQKEKAKHIIKDFRGNDGGLLKKLEKFDQAQN